MTRKEAIAAGEKRYQGKPCPVGHNGLRYTSSGSCVECALIYHRKWTAQSSLDWGRYWRAKILNDPVRAPLYRAAKAANRKKQYWKHREKEIEKAKRRYRIKRDSGVFIEAGRGSKWWNTLKLVYPEATR